MNAPVTMAHLCGPLGQALAVVDGETWLYEGQDRRPPTSNDIRFFFDFGLEVRLLDPLKDGSLNERNLRTALLLEARRFRALQGLLVGMDAEVSDDLRARSMQSADRLLADRSVSSFVETRFLRPLSQQAWDINGARRLAQGKKLAGAARLYAIVDSPLLLRVEDEVEAWALEQGQRSVERAATLDKAYDSGLIAMLATALHDGNQSDVRMRIFLAKDVDWDRRLAGRLIARFVHLDARSGAETSPQENDEHPEQSAADIVSEVTARIAQLLEEYRERKRFQHFRTRKEEAGVNAFEAFEAAIQQIDWIAGRFESGRWEAAWQDVAKLADRQLAHGGPGKLAMSLTNLATQLSQLQHVALPLCDLAAACAPDDPTVWNARAELLRGWGRLEEALAAYERTIEDFRNDVFARTGRAETLRAMGRLEEALAAYERTIEDFRNDVVARNGRAETLRAMGRLEEALAAYERTIEDFRNDVVARNGYAVVLGELGRFDEARAVLKDVGVQPRTAQDWTAAHILCMIDFRNDGSSRLIQRLERYAADCPFYSHKLYFETTLAVARIALKRTREARRDLKAISRRPGLIPEERAAVTLMEAHAEAADGDLAAARQTLAVASNVIPYAHFRLRRLQQEIERHFGLGSSPAPTRVDEIAVSEKKLIRLEMDFWVDRAAESGPMRRVA